MCSKGGWATKCHTDGRVGEQPKCVLLNGWVIQCRKVCPISSLGVNRRAWHVLCLGLSKKARHISSLGVNRRACHVSCLGLRRKAHHVSSLGVNRRVRHVSCLGVSGWACPVMSVHWIVVVLCHQGLFISRKVDGLSSVLTDGRVNGTANVNVSWEKVWSNECRDQWVGG